MATRAPATRLTFTPVWALGSAWALAAATSSTYGAVMAADVPTTAAVGAIVGTVGMLASLLAKFLLSTMKSSERNHRADLASRERDLAYLRWENAMLRHQLNPNLYPKAGPPPSPVFSEEDA